MASKNKVKKIIKKNKNADISSTISDDILDSLECDVYDLDQIKSLEIKMQRHHELKQKTNTLINEVDQLIIAMQKIKKLDSIDSKDLSTKLDKLNDAGDHHITSDKIGKIILDIDHDTENIASIEQIGNRIAHYEQIMKKIRLCKDFYDKGNVIIENVNTTK